MERRSWPWKRKTSEKASSESYSPKACLSHKGVKHGEEEHKKPASFIQISQQKYERLNVLEEEVEVLKEKLVYMKEKLTSSQADLSTKDDLVKQHAKVAEEAISGWEKAEAETLDLKQDLESVTLLKLAAEEHSAHLDSALKESVNQIRNVREEGEKKLHDAVFTETKMREKVKSDLEATITGFEQELLNGYAEIAALSRSLQEHSVLLMKIREEKSQADADIEVLKTNIQSYEKEANSLKYELNIAAREVEISNEEKDMSVKSAEVAHKQHIEDVKKITKLEAECQRLRGLVRKRLPGPATVAQMKAEVESLGHGFAESRVRRLSGKSSGPSPFSPPKVNVNEVEHCYKENEFLISRLLAMEEESKILKEALSKTNSELQASSSRCLKIAKKLQILEAQMLLVNQQKSLLKSNIDIPFKGSSSQHENNHSLASMSEDGVDDEASCAESWASALISELSQLKKERSSHGSMKTQNSNQLELMDDFLEMERLAGLSSETNGVVIVSGEGMDDIKTENGDDCSSVDVHMCVCKEQSPSTKHHPNAHLVAETPPSGELLSIIQARISSDFESKVLDSKTGKLVDEIMKILLYPNKERPLHSSDLLNVGVLCGTEAAHYGTALTHHSNSYREIENSTNQEFRSAISWIHEFIIFIYKEESLGKASDHQAIREKVEEFSGSVKKLLGINLNLDCFIHSLRRLLAESKELGLRKWFMEESCCNDCIDKVTLLENGVARHDSAEEKKPRDHDRLPSVSGAEVVKGHGNQSDATPHNFSSEEFENLKMERDDIEVNFINCRETLESTKLYLADTELNLAEFKRQLSASQKSNDLADTQLRCMTESYKLLESRAEDLQAEINLLRSKAKVLEDELNAERHSHQDDMDRFTALQKQIRTSCLKCSCHADDDILTKARQDREFDAAADKLAACQEAIILLNQQLNSLHSPVETRRSSHYREESKKSRHPAMESDAVSSSMNQAESPPHECSSQFSTSKMESSPIQKPTLSAQCPKHRSRSTSASSLSSMLSDKHGRGCGRRFFSKGKSEL